MTAEVAPGRLARAFHGITLKRVAVFCGIVAMTAVGSGMTTVLMAGKGLTPGLWAFAWQYAHHLPLFSSTGIAVVVAGNWAPTRTGPRVLAFASAVVVGMLVGVLLTTGVMYLWPPHGKEAPGLFKAIGAIVLWSHVIAAGVLGYFFMTREEDAIAKLHVEEMRRVHLDRELAEARLQVMQAQVEPHFLFNTLANVRRLFQTDPAAARAMIEHLSRYLTAMLPQMRSNHSTLQHELALTLAYLQVQKIRMADRLTVRVDVPEELKSTSFPPMMLVTLVENAIRHGLNPLPQGGEVRIAARVADGRLRVQVADTGCGLSESSGSGVGLANIRARLSTLYGGDARLLLVQNPDTGVVATIELPMVEPSSDARAA